MSNIEMIRETEWLAGIVKFPCTAFLFQKIKIIYKSKFFMFPFALCKSAFDKPHPRITLNILFCLACD